MPDHLLVVQYDWTKFGTDVKASEALNEALDQILRFIGSERGFIMKAKGKVKIDRSDDNSTESPHTKVGAVTQSTPVTRMQPGPTALGPWEKKVS